MQISQVLAQRLLRNAISPVASTQLLSEWPTSIAYHPPLPPSTQKLVAVSHGPQTYDLLQATSHSYAEIQAFYINRLRLEGWQYKSADRRAEIALTGLSRKAQIAQRSHSFFHLGKDLLLHLSPIDADPDNRFLLSLEPASRTAELRTAASQSHFNLVPIPYLRPIESSRYRGGSGGGNDQSYREVRFLESKRPLSPTFEHYQTQIAPAWQLENAHTNEQLAYSQWHYQDATGRRWRLSLCVAASTVVCDYLIFLSVDEIKSDYLPLQATDLDLNRALVEQLIRAKHPDSTFCLNEVPAALRDRFPIPDEAKLLAAVENPQQWRKIWLELEGSADDVYAESVRQIEATGWQLVLTANFPDEIGFEKTAFHAIAPVVFAKTDNPNQRLRLWTAPADESAVIVEMLTDSLPNQKAYSFDPRKSNTGGHVESYPTLLLSAPTDSLIHSCSHRVGLWAWNASADIFSDRSLDQLVTHYRDQLIDAEWREIASSPLTSDESASVSSWSLRDSQGKVWQALFQVTQQEKENGYTALLQVVTLNPEFE